MAQILTVLLFIAPLKIGAEEVSPHTPPAAATKGGSVSHLNAKKEANNTEDKNASNSPQFTCPPCSNCCPVQQSQTKTEEEKAEEAALKLLNRRYMWAAICGVFIALLGVSALMWQTEITRRSWQRQLRAYVLPERVGFLASDPANPNIPCVAIVIKNSGQTPAYKLVSWMKLAVIPRAEEYIGLPVPQMEERSPMTIGAQGEFHKTCALDRPLTANEITDIGDGTRAIYVYGKMVYQDTFKKARFTDFRLHYVGAYPPPGDTLFFFSERGNDAN